MKTNRKYYLYPLFALLAIALVIHVLNPVLTVATILSVRQEQHKEIEAGAKRSSYLVLELSKIQFSNCFDKEEGELKINGSLFDIVKVDSLGDQIVCTLLPDEAEASLLTNLLHQIDPDGKSDNIKRYQLWWPLSAGPASLLISTKTEIWVSPVFVYSVTNAVRLGYASRLEKPPTGLLT